MQDNHKQELVDRLIEVVEWLNREASSGRLDEWQRLDMTVPQIKVVVLLEGAGSLRMGAIAGYLGISLSATTSVVDRLVEKRLVRRLSDPTDRRVVVCELTPLGVETIQSFWRVDRQRLLVLAEQLEEAQLESAVQGLEIIRQAEEEIQRRADPATAGN